MREGKRLWLFPQSETKLDLWAGSAITRERRETYMDRLRLLEVVVEIVGKRAENKCVTVGPTTRLGVGGLGLDSIEILDLVLEVEDKTGLPLRDEQLTAAALESPSTIVEFLAGDGQR